MKTTGITAGHLIGRTELRELQKYRGWKIRILEELQHSGGMTTREISTRIDYPCHSTVNRLVEMHDRGFVEKVERWGWKITLDGVNLLSLNYTTTTPQQHHNITTTLPQLDVNGEFPLQNEKKPSLVFDFAVEIEKPACYENTTCHIKQLCRDPGYSLKNRELCPNCVWNTSKLVHIFPRFPVETREVGDDPHQKNLEDYNG